MNWTLWQNIVSPHLSPIARALALMPGQTVTIVAESEMPARRLGMGWRTPECFPARVIIQPTSKQVEQLIAADSGLADPRESAVHLMNGLPGVPLNQCVLPRLAQIGATIGLISETADNRGLLGFVRRTKYRRDRHYVEKKINFILAMGQLGVAWFASAGYDAARIFPFAYATERPVFAEKQEAEGNETLFRILYLGRILRLKDGVTAIRALQRFSAPAWDLNVVGDGPDLPRWKTAAARSGVSSRIHFLPAVEGRLVGKLLQDTDLLLLPSRKDGWGAVVNEALMSGVPVICSDNCGAADLLREPWRGSTFKAGSVESLQEQLRGWIEHGRPTIESRARIREWSTVLEGPRVAQYMVEVVDYVRTGGQRPCPPWY